MNDKLLEITTEVYYLKMYEKPGFLEEKNKKVNTEFNKLPSPIKTNDYLFYYKTVGEAYNWLDRILMEETTLSKIINASNTTIFNYRINNKEAGFAEFVREEDYTEILYFGLFNDFVGKGYGKQFLQEVISEAWSNNPKWIQLNTCKLDHPNALLNYQKNGFVLQETKLEKRKIKKY